MANITAKWADTQVCPYNAHIVAQYANITANVQNTVPKKNRPRRPGARP